MAKGARSYSGGPADLEFPKLFEVELDRLTHVALDLFPGGPGCDAAGEIGGIGGVASTSSFDDDARRIGPGHGCVVVVAEQVVWRTTPVESQRCPDGLQAYRLHQQ